MSKIELPFKLTRLEIIVCLSVGILVCSFLLFNIINTPVWYWRGRPNLAYFSKEHQQLYMFTPFVGVFMAISTLFLLRLLRGNTYYFSRWGHFVLAWPLIDLFTIYPGFFFFLVIFLLPIQLWMAVIIALITVFRQGKVNDVVIVGISAAWTWVGFHYSWMWISLVVD